MKIDVAIADDHPLVLSGLNSILAEYDHIRVCDSYINGEKLMDGLKVHIPDVLLLDIQMPGKSADILTPQIIKDYPQVKIVIITNFDNVLYINQLMKKGASGYLLKTADREVLVQAIETVYRGGRYIDSALVDKYQKSSIRENAVTQKILLSNREKEILQHIVNGLTNREIAAKIHLSVHTIENYRDSILLKLDVKNTASLVKSALLNGLAQ